MTKEKTFYSDRIPPKKTEEEQVTELELWIGSTRRMISSEFEVVNQKVNLLTNVWIEKEKDLLQLYNHYHDKREKLLPAFIYVLIGGFAGSIVTKNRNVALRTIGPVIGSAGTFGYFFPRTSLNLMYNNEQDPKSTLPRIAALDSFKSTISSVVDSLFK